MELFVHQTGFYWGGQWQDLVEILSAYPPETTLRDFIKLHFN